MRKPNPKIDRESPAFRIMSYWGTPSNFARALGKRPSGVHLWLENGEIPQRNHAKIWEAAKRDGKPLKPVDFIDARNFPRTAAKLAGQPAAA